MDKEIINQFLQILMPILATVLTAVFTYLGNKIKNAYETKLKNETAKTIVDDTVRYVQQVYKDLNGTEKLQKAIEKAQEVLAEKGIILTDVEINMLIESSVFTLKNILMEPKEETVQVEEKETKKKKLTE